MNELMKKYKSNIKVVSFEIMKSSKPHKINPSCSRFCGLFVLNIYVCKVIVVFLSVSCSSIYSNMPSDLNTLGSLPDFDTLSSYSNMDILCSSVDLIFCVRFQNCVLLSLSSDFCSLSSSLESSTHLSSSDLLTLRTWTCIYLLKITAKLVVVYITM